MPLRRICWKGVKKGLWGSGTSWSNWNICGAGERQWYRRLLRHRQYQQQCLPALSSTIMKYFSFRMHQVEFRSIWVISFNFSYLLLIHHFIIILFIPPNFSMSSSTGPPLQSEAITHATVADCALGVWVLGRTGVVVPRGAHIQHGNGSAHLAASPYVCMNMNSYVM